MSASSVEYIGGPVGSNRETMTAPTELEALDVSEYPLDEYEYNGMNNTETPGETPTNSVESSDTMSDGAADPNISPADPVPEDIEVNSYDLPPPTENPAETGPVAKKTSPAQPEGLSAGHWVLMGLAAVFIIVLLFGKNR